MLEPHDLTENQMKDFVRLSRKNYLDRTEFGNVLSLLMPQFCFSRKTISEYLGNKADKKDFNRKLFLFAIREIRKQQGDEVYALILHDIGVQTLQAA